MISRAMGIGAVLLAVVLAGCHSNKGKIRVDYDPAQPLMMTTALEDGEYALYTAGDEGPRVVQKLKAGDQLGFEKTDVGRIRAVAGPYSTVLDPMQASSARASPSRPYRSIASLPILSTPASLSRCAGTATAAAKFRDAASHIGSLLPLSGVS